MNIYPAEDPTDPVRFTSSTTVDEDFAKRMSLGMMKNLILRRRRLWSLVPPLLFLLLGLRAMSNSADTPWVVLLPGLLLLAAFGTVFAIVYARLISDMRNRYPVGSDYSIVLRDSGLGVTTTDSSSFSSFRLFTEVRVTRELLVLEPTRGSAPSMLPIELFSADSIEWLNSKVKAI